MNAKKAVTFLATFGNTLLIVINLSSIGSAQDSLFENAENDIPLADTTTDYFASPALRVTPQTSVLTNQDVAPGPREQDDVQAFQIDARTFSDMLNDPNISGPLYRFIADAVFEPPQNLLPAILDPNSMQDDMVTRKSKYGAAITGRPLGIPVALRSTVQVKLDMKYETGGGNTPASVVLSGTDEARRAGRFDISSGTTNLGFDLQNIADPTRVQGQAELEIDENGIVRLRNAFGRVALPGQQFNILGGKYFTTFGDGRALPQSIIKNLVTAGNVSRTELPQLRLVRTFGNCSTAFAIEDSLNDDIMLPATTDEIIDRVPDFVLNFRCENPNTCQSFNAIQVAGIVRTFGFEDITREEHFTNGYGASAIARFISNHNTLSNWRMGIAGGRGVGAYLFGLSSDATAVAPLNGILRPVDNIGGYVSYQHRWSQYCAANFAYGYVLSEVFPGMDADAQRKVHNGWVNLVRHFNKDVALGVEYHFLSRRVLDGSTGENHQFVFAIHWAPKLEPKPTDPQTRAVSPMFLDTQRPPILPSPGTFDRFRAPSRFKSL